MQSKVSIVTAYCEKAYILWQSSLVVSYFLGMDLTAASSCNTVVWVVLHAPATHRVGAAAWWVAISNT